MERNRFVVAAKALVLDDDGRLLTVRRSATASRRALTWDFPGGIVEAGEQPDQAVLRELTEETSVTADEAILFTAVTHEHILFIVYLIRGVTKREVVLSFEHDDFGWIKPADFEKLEAPEYFKEMARSLAKRL